MRVYWIYSSGQPTQVIAIKPTILQGSNIFH
jgi:hypothetical protein